MSPLSRRALIADLGALRECGRRHGPLEIEALRVFTAAGTQELELPARLYAFSRHTFSERMRHGDDGFDQCTRGIVLWDFFQECAVQFYGVDGISTKVVERRIAS